MTTNTKVTYSLTCSERNILLTLISDVDNNTPYGNEVEEKKYIERSELYKSMLRGETPVENLLNNYVIPTPRKIEANESFYTVHFYGYKLEMRAIKMLLLNACGLVTLPQAKETESETIARFRVNNLTRKDASIIFESNKNLFTNYVVHNESEEKAAIAKEIAARNKKVKKVPATK